MSVRAILRAVAGLALAAACGGTHAQPTPEDRLLLRKIETLCQENAGNVEMSTLLQCWNLRVARDDMLADMSYHVTGLCRDISARCARVERTADGDRLEVYSTVLQCTQFGYRCERSSPIVAMVRNKVQDKAEEHFGDLASVVDTLASLNVELPPELKRAAVAADEAYRIGRDYAEAARQMDRQLHMFYAGAYERCRANSPDAQGGQMGRGSQWADECTAAIDRQYQARAVERVLNWNSPTSVVSCGTDAVIARWKSELGMGAAALAPCPRARQ